MGNDNKFSKIPLGQRQRPLMMQLALAAGAFAQPKLLKGKKFTDDFWTRPDGQLARASMEKVVAGLRRYQMHPYQRPLQNVSRVWSDGESRLVWIAGKKPRKNGQPKASLLIIPSMINGSEILDILPEKRSLVRWLAGQGFDVFLFEWGDLKRDPDLMNMDTAIAGKLMQAAQWLKKETDTPLAGLGYCMGGLFLAALDALDPDLFANLVFVATPWDFKAGARGNFAEALTSWAEEGLPRIAHLDYMPHEWLQMIFAGTDPAMMAHKFSAFADMKEESLEEKIFVAVEDWVNSGVDLPAGIIKSTVKDWYLDNKVVNGKWVVAGQKINARKINKPSLVIVPAKDKIVPPASAKPLSEQIPDAYILTPECGHISMMVGSRAEEEVWKPMKGWISNHLD